MTKTIISVVLPLLAALIVHDKVIVDLWGEWWGAGMVICLDRDADLHMAQLMPLPLTVSCCSKIQTGFTFLVPAHLGSPGQRAVKRVCVCVSGVIKMQVGYNRYRLSQMDPSNGTVL